jgi:uncharacterized delta-60 repeat protein
MYRRLLPAAVAALLVPLSQAGTGDLDPGFGPGGLVTTPVLAGDDGAEALALQPDGRLVAVGAASNGTDEDFAVVRYNADGTLDASFGTGGRVTTPIGAADDHANAVALQTDGKILVGGYSVASGNERFALVRYNTNGTLDTGFGSGGKVTSAFAGQAGIADIALQADGRIVAAGAHDPGVFSPAVFALERYNSNGSLDGAFGTGGRVTTVIQSAGNGAAGVLVQPDGRIVAAGIAATIFGGSFALVRYNTNGTLDGTFGTGGIVTTVVGSGFAGALTVVRQPDGKLVAGGGLDGSLSFILVRYNASGSVDATFGTNGIVTTAFNGPASALVVEPDGRIAAAGGNADFGLARYLANGALDPSFGTGGKVTTSTGAPAKDLVRQVDGRLVAAGFVAGATLDFAIARYEGLSAPIAFCQGTDQNCPCGGGLPETGCQNAQLTGGVQLAATSYLPNGAGGGTAVLLGTNFPAMLSPAAVLIRSRGGETPPVLFGNGLRCITLPGLLRIGANLASGGSVAFNVTHGAGPGAFHYQLWFRDQPVSFCNPTAGFNLSNALSIPWW